MAGWAPRQASRGAPCDRLCPHRCRNALGKARRFELERHSVVLCTCSCAASASLQTLDIRQILVDEAGMATEPETLIPLVRFPKVEKVRDGQWGPCPGWGPRGEGLH